jgi:Leucine-rich repeat (LRR) protein
MRVLLGFLLVGIAGCGGEETSPDDVAVPPSPTISPVKSENAKAGAPKTKPVSSDDVPEAESKDLFQAQTEEPTDVPSDRSSDGAVAALTKLGARIKQDDQGNDVELNLSRSKITDAGLRQLKGLTALESLDLMSCRNITDAGMVHLKGMTHLHALNLSGTQITDAGLVHLKGMTKLQTLALYHTEITDAGLLHLKRLNELEVLSLINTDVTDAGL